MTKLVIRHGLSGANDVNNYGTPAFGNPEAPLLPEGRQQAAQLGQRLRTDYGIDLIAETVAVSEMRRTQETAIGAGFRRLHIYRELNEEKGGLSDADVRIALNTKSPPEATIKAARFLLEYPPEEKIWVAHAFLIAAICQELGIYQKDRFHPRFCEIRELPI